MQRLRPYLIHNRYQLLRKIGDGGMGSVYSALDLLVDQTVALKRVRLDKTSPIEIDSYHQRRSALVTLTREFQTLTTLNHPHIVSVLDFGFDDDGRSFFTMSLIDNAQDIVTAGERGDNRVKTQYLIELLQALTYLHRHRVVHRDLKPSNVLIDESGHVRVVDFGLATQAGIISGVEGTLAYIAPEVLQNRIATPASDLYAVGVIAYELFAGVHPFGKLSVGQLLQTVTKKVVDLSSIDAPDAVRNIIGRLLQIDPDARYSSAEAVIDALCAAADVAPPHHSAVLGDSYWQSAGFVGREQELNRLVSALDQAMKGHGGAYALIGESGVGKSRLLNELRTLALTRGALVLRGGGVADGGLPYQLWRGIARELLLLHDVTDDQAAILAALVPDIERLLDREIPPAPSLSDEAEQQRLILALLHLIGQQTRPLVLLLDDLQWAGESLIPLARICDLVAKQGLLIVGTYRTGENAESAHILSKLHAIPLKPFSVSETQIVSEAIIGDLSGRRALLQFLVDHTEGNAFFLIETLRTLAIHVERLEEIGLRDMPQKVVPQSIRDVALRRLQRLSEPDQKAVQAAALLGRDLDLSLLKHILPQLDVEGWLVRADAAALLRFEDAHWRFAHDMMREGIVAALSDLCRVTLSRRCAEALEAIYGDRADYARRLAQHWKAAGDLNKEVQYAIIAARQAIRLTYFVETRTELLSLIDRMQVGVGLDKELSLLHRLIAETYHKTIGYPEAQAHYEQSLMLAQRLGDTAGQADTLLGIGRVLSLRGLGDEAEIRLASALALYDALGDVRGSAETHHVIGDVHYQRGDYAAAHAAFQASFDILANTGEFALRAQARSGLAYTANIQGKYAEAERLARENLAYFIQIDDKHEIAAARTALYLALINQGELEQAFDYAQMNLRLCEEINHQSGRATTLVNLGYLVAVLGRWDESEIYYADAARLSQQLGSTHGAATAFGSLIDVQTRLGKWEAARQSAGEWISSAHQVNIVRVQLHGMYAVILIVIHDQKAVLAAEWLGAFEHYVLPSQRNDHQLVGLREQISAQIGTAQTDAGMERGSKLTLEQLTDQLIAYFSVV
mgnify:CR=1 FL=1